jgi:hypothetical protein
VERRGTARTLPNFCVVLCIVCFVSFSVLFVCKCVLYYCHRVATQLQLTNLSYHIVSYIISVYDMKAYRGEELWLHSLSTSAVAEDEWSSSRPGRFNPRKQRRFPLSSWIEWSHNWTGCSGQEKYPLLYRDSNPGPATPILVTHDTH